MMSVYSIILNEFYEKPRDVITVPQRGKGKWFYVYTRNSIVYVEGGKNHSNVSKISSPRKLNINEAEKMLDLYHRRCKGECISQLATETTQNQVYWYGIFAELDL
jgi:hypothetical protein